MFPRSVRDDRLLRYSKLQSTLLHEIENEILPEFRTKGFTGRTIEYQQHNWKCPPETGDSVLFGRKYAMAPTIDVKDPSRAEEVDFFNETWLGSLVRLGSRVYVQLN